MSASATRQDVDTGDGAEGVLVARTDSPTRTKTVEERYAQKLRGGYQRINTVVRKYVGERDVLGLGDGELTAVEAPPDFSFIRDDQKISEFREWLDQAQEDEILDVVGEGENRYVRQAYETGVRATNADIRQAGVGTPATNAAVSLQLPIHQDTLQRLFTRNFSELQGLTDEMGRDVARELTESMARGEGPRDAARRLTDVLGSVEDGTPHGAQARATTIARTEMLRARHLAAQEQYQRFGVELVEPLLAPSACPQCVAVAAGAPYKASEISGIWPVHPNCRCSVTVYTGSAEATASAYRVPVEMAETLAASPAPMTPERLHATGA
ncbi:phage minor head protein [Haloarcula sp. GH36]|uniref:phage minor head protein n=1 Tax=Haloarcula montana TaxID=3111776 RepID=UPI002D77416D|nr:phage minor head protein [Haloarcula sp. GH36]